MGGVGGELVVIVCLLLFFLLFWGVGAWEWVTCICLILSFYPLTEGT